MSESILLIDDNKHLRVTLSDQLIHQGYDCVTAASGEEALKKMEEISPSLIILDISMPGMGGIGFLRQIQDKDGNPRYPVLVLTARETMREFFGTVTVDGFLAKPCPMSELLTKIQEVFSLRAVKEQNEESAPTETATSLRSAILAEDDPTVSTQIVKSFRAAGIDVEIVDSGPQLLEKAPNMRPDVIVMKQLLPRMNGNVLAPLLAAMPSLEHVPIVLYDDTRKFDDTHAFVSRLPGCVTRFVASNQGHDLLRIVKDSSEIR